MLTTKIREIWSGIAAYANEATVDEVRLRATMLSCLPVTSKQAFGFVDRVVDARTFPKQALKYQGSIRALLLALCSGSLGSEGFKFLSEHFSHVRMTIDEIPAPDSEGSEKYYSNGVRKPSPLGLWGLSMDANDIVDPLCAFIVRECERVREEGSQLPLFVCDLCKEIFVPARMKAKNRFCSENCGTRLHNHQNSEARSSEQFLRRLAKLPVSVIGKKLAGSAYRKRYEDHKARATQHFPRSRKHVDKIESKSVTSRLRTATPRTTRASE